MLPEVEDFIHRIKNYTVQRSVSENVLEQEKDLVELWHKRRLNECYSFLKYLSLRPDNLSLKKEVEAVTSLTREVEIGFAKWKGIYVQENC